MEVIFALVALVFAVLQIILFFKIWSMTDDVKEIKNKYVGSDSHIVVTKTSSIQPVSHEVVKSVDGLVVGEEYLVDGVGPKVKIVSFENNGMVKCETPLGTGSFLKSRLK